MNDCPGRTHGAHTWLTDRTCLNCRCCCRIHVTNHVLNPVDQTGHASVAAFGHCLNCPVHGSGRPTPRPEAVAEEMWELLGRALAPSKSLSDEGLKQEIRDVMHRYEQMRFGVD